MKPTFIIRPESFKLKDTKIRNLLNVINVESQDHSQLIITKFRNLEETHQFFHTELPLNVKLHIVDSVEDSIESKWKYNGLYKEDCESWNKGDGALGYWSNYTLNSFRETPELINIYDWDRNHKLSQRNLTWLINNVPEGDIIYLHNVEDLFNFYDKGGLLEDGKRFINYIMRLMYDDKKHIWVCNTNVATMQQYYHENIRRFHHANERSLNVMKEFLNQHHIVSYNDYDEKFFYTRVFNNQWDLRKFISDFATSNFIKAEAQVKRLMNFIEIKSCNDLMYIYDNDICKDINKNSQSKNHYQKTIYGFGSVHKLADQLGLPRRFIVKMMYYYITQTEISDIEFLNEQYHVYTDTYQMWECYRNNTCRESNSFNYENDFCDKHYTLSPIEISEYSPVYILKLLHEEKISSSNPITYDLVDKCSSLILHPLFKNYILRNVFGYKHKIPKDIIDHVGTSLIRRCDWNELWSAQEGYDGVYSKDTAEDSLYKALTLMSIYGIYSIYPKFNIDKGYNYDKVLSESDGFLDVARDKVFAMTQINQNIQMAI